VDVRQDGMDRTSPIVSNLPAVTMQWASPLAVDEAANAERQVTVLLQSTAGSWLRSEMDVNPKLDVYPELGFPVEGEQKARPLAVSVRGSFESYFKERPSPFEGGGEATSGEGAADAPQTEQVIGTIDVSPESSRLVVVGSAEFLDDAVLQISRGSGQDRYLNNLQFVQNAIDWAVQDEDLLAIRSRGTYARMLVNLTQEQQTMWEWINYAVALLGVVAIGIVWNARRRGEEPIELVESDLG
jgi:ABC-2 type transport system permease protein